MRRRLPQLVKVAAIGDVVGLPVLHCCTNPRCDRGTRGCDRNDPPIPRLPEQQYRVFGGSSR